MPPLWATPLAKQTKVLISTTLTPLFPSVTTGFAIIYPHIRRLFNYLLLSRDIGYPISQINLLHTASLISHLATSRQESSLNLSPFTDSLLSCGISFFLSRSSLAPQRGRQFSFRACRGPKRPHICPLRPLFLSPSSALSSCGDLGDLIVVVGCSTGGKGMWAEFFTLRNWKCFGL